MRALLLSVLFLTAGLLNAQSTAKQLLQKVESHLTEADNVQYTYSLTIDFPDQDPIVKSGTFKKKGDKYHATIGQRWVKSDGKTQWIFDPDMNEVQIFNAEENDGLPISPEMITELYQSDEFEYAITGKEQLKGQEITLIEFKSNDPGSEYVKMRLALYSSNAKPVYFKVFERNGSRYDLSIDEINENVSYEEGEFTFDKSKHPNVHVEDLRM